VKKIQDLPLLSALPKNQKHRVVIRDIRTIRVIHGKAGSSCPEANNTYPRLISATASAKERFEAGYLTIDRSKCLRYYWCDVSV
jgi:hypothetical protein